MQVLITFLSNIPLLEKLNLPKWLLWILVIFATGLNMSIAEFGVLKGINGEPYTAGFVLEVEEGNLLQASLYRSSAIHVGVWGQSYYVPESLTLYNKEEKVDLGSSGINTHRVPADDVRVLMAELFTNKCYSGVTLFKEFRDIGYTFQVSCPVLYKPSETVDNMVVVGNITFLYDKRPMDISKEINILRHLTDHTRVKSKY